MTGVAPPAPRTPGSADAVRATIGVVVAYAAALLLGGLVGLISGAANHGIHRRATRAPSSRCRP